MKTLSAIFATAAILISQSANAQPANAAAEQGPLGSLGMFLPMILVFVIFYFLMIRPQQKQRKQHQALIQGIKKGDEVITSSGIYARVHGVMENIVTLEIADNVRIKMDKQQVATVKTAGAAS
jgi:preprotein translocase subunit YajC